MVMGYNFLSIYHTIIPCPLLAVKCIPEARTGGAAERKFGKIIIYVGSNDTRLILSEVTKMNIESVCNFAKTMSDSKFSLGPLSSQTRTDMFNHMFSSNCCSVSGVQDIMWALWLKENLEKKSEA